MTPAVDEVCRHLLWVHLLLRSMQTRRDLLWWPSVRQGTMVLVLVFGAALELVVHDCRMHWDLYAAEFGLAVSTAARESGPW